MTQAHQMLATHPHGAGNASLASALDALAACALACTICADACLAEEDVETLRRCIRLDLDCADVCTATASILARQTSGDPSLLRAQLEACLVACRSCAEECEAHADHMEHCRLCAEACRACEGACREAMASVAA
jgi:hypothetical protein